MSDELRNPGWDNRFTCPKCITDFEGVRTTKCPGCGAAIICRVIQEPVAVCELNTEKGTEEDDEV